MTARPTTHTSRKTVFSAWFLVGLCLLLLPNSLTLHCQTLFRHAFQVPLQFGSRIPALSAPKQVRQVADPNLLSYVRELEEKTHAQSNYIANLEATLADQQGRIHLLNGIRENPGLNHLGLEAADVVMAPRPDYLVLNFRIQDPDALKKGLYAIVNNAMVGRIVKANPFDSELQLVTHPESVVRAFINNSQANKTSKQIFGRLQGTAEGIMRMVVNSREPIRIGAPVHAQKQPYLSVPFLIGRVSGCDHHKESPVLWEVLVEPAVPLQNLGQVCVLRPKE